MVLSWTTSRGSANGGLGIIALVRLPGVTYTGPESDDAEVLARVPRDARELLDIANGVVAFDGGLHVRGACREPEWHSLRAVW